MISECDLGISNTQETWPALCSGVAYILLSRMTLALRLHQAQYPVPRLVTHIPGVFSIWLPLAVHIVSTQIRGFIQVPSGKEQHKIKHEQLGGTTRVLSLRALPSGSPLSLQILCHPAFPWTPQLPLTSAQQTNTITPPVNDISLFSGPRELSRCRERQVLSGRRVCFPRPQRITNEEYNTYSEKKTRPKISLSDF